MILIDTNILVTFATVGKLPLLLQLFSGQQIAITPNVLSEINKAKSLNYAHAEKILNFVQEKRIAVIQPTEDELTFSAQLPDNFGLGERDSIAIARKRDYIFLTNERRIVRFCEKEGIICLWLDQLLRLFWREGILSKEQVRDLIVEIEKYDRIIIVAKENIFVD